MRSVSDNGATAPISALTYAFSIGSDRGFNADDFEARIIADRTKQMPRVNRIDKSKRGAVLVNPIDKSIAPASPAHEPQQLQRGDGSEPPGPTRQGAHVHAASVVGDHRHHELVVVAFELDMDALIGSCWGLGRG